MKLLDAIQSRRSIRKFKNKKVKWSDILEAIDAATQTPLAGNQNTLRFVIVTDPQIKQHMGLCADQQWIAEADTIIVVCSDDSPLVSLYDDRAEKYGRQQIGAAIQNFLLRLTDLGLASCWIGSFLENEIKNVLQMPEEMKVEAILPVGYANEKPKSTKKASLQNIIFWDKWNVKKKPTYIKDPSTW